MDLVSTLVIAMVIVHLSSNALSSIAIYIMIIFSLEYYSSFFNGTVRISNNEYLMAIIFPSFSAPYFLENMFRVNIHYIS
jgi:hypothetical protein